MTLYKLLVPLVVLLLWALTALSNAQPVEGDPSKDGHLYDQGRSMTEISPRAPKALDKMNAILGQWDVEVTTYPTDSTSHSTEGMAEISLMNRGHAYMSRIHIPGYDEAGNEANIIHFLNFNPTNSTWVLGEANSYTESISMYNGDFKRKKLVLSTVVREGGGTLLTWYQVDYTLNSDSKFTYTVQTSQDKGETWTPRSTHVYKRRSASAGFMQPGEGYGTPAANRPKESKQFDFLLGEWNASHNINFNNQWIQFPANATAVYALNGHAILEHNWYDVDPNVPDAATTIVRIYNRAMRRWESLYLDNRGHSQLFFGGAKEDDTIILHNFEANTTSPLIPRYVFHDIATDSYAWYAENSTDRGQTFNETWKITFARK